MWYRALRFPGHVVRVHALPADACKQNTLPPPPASPPPPPPADPRNQKNMTRTQQGNKQPWSDGFHTMAVDWAADSIACER